MSAEDKIQVITAGSYSLSEYFGRLRRSRFVWRALIEKELRQQYVQTRFGLMWAVIKPVVIVVVFTLLFSYFLKVSSHYPYALFALSGLIAWTLFINILNNGSSVVRSNIGLSRKMGLPLLLLPFLSIVTALIEWLITFLLLLLLMIVLKVFPQENILLMPLVIIINILPGAGLMLWLNSLSVRYRDLQQIVPYLAGFLIWLSPVFFPVTIIPAEYVWLIELNPLTGILNFNRFALFNDVFNFPAVMWAFVVGVIVFTTGIWNFIGKESDMIDYL